LSDWQSRQLSRASSHPVRRDGATDDELCSAILGRSGTLRAPAMRVGEIFVVGFHPEGYAEVFGV
jgi:hypothetical protein